MFGPVAPGEPTGQLRRGQRHEGDGPGRRGRRGVEQHGTEHQDGTGALHRHAERVRRVVSHLQHPERPPVHEDQREQDHEQDEQRPDLGPVAPVEGAGEPDHRAGGVHQGGLGQEVVDARGEHGRRADAPVSTSSESTSPLKAPSMSVSSRSPTTSGFLAPVRSTVAQSAAACPPPGVRRRSRCVRPRPPRRCRARCPGRSEWSGRCWRRTTAARGPPRRRPPRTATR
ncbi:hypothetical protein LSPH26S_04753 [Lysinibacillus sphaericus]